PSRGKRIMDRLACVNLPRFALQILLRKNPGWENLPVAVTREEKPMSPLLELNKIAEARGGRIGARYAEALTLLPDLRAGIVTAAEISESRERVAAILAVFSPGVEPSVSDAGVMWVDASGLEGLFGSLARWLVRARAALAAEGYRARMAIGYTRAGTYALAK